MVSALDFQAGYRGFESRSGRDNFQTFLLRLAHTRRTLGGLSIKWTGRRLVIDSGTDCAWGDPWKQGYIIAIAAASMCLGCLVAFKIRTTTTNFSMGSFKLENIYKALLPQIITIWEKCVFFLEPFQKSQNMIIFYQQCFCCTKTQK